LTTTVDVTENIIEWTLGVYHTSHDVQLHVTDLERADIGYTKNITDIILASMKYDFLPNRKYRIEIRVSGKTKALSTYKCEQ
jgi:hypothetical protein